MSKKKQHRIKARCASCGHEFIVEADEPQVVKLQLQCPNCAAYHVYSVGRVKSIIRVEGTNANEVKNVATALTDKVIEKHKASMVIHNPWISGSFYLAGAVIIDTLFLVMARSVNVLILPVVIMGTLLLVSIVGAFQLRQDSALSQKNFLSLMLMVFRQIPFLRKQDNGNNRK